MNRNLVITSLVVGVLCGAWAGIAPEAGLSIWAGFAGCTAYFASGAHKGKGLSLTLATTLVGVGTALLMIEGSDFIGPPLGTAVAVGAVVTLIVMMGAVKFLAFVPGIFVGCYSTFAINADWRLLGASLIAGAVLGMLCDWGAEIAVAKLGTDEPAVAPQTPAQV
jgi:hypothetical protein